MLPEPVHGGRNDDQSMVDLGVRGPVAQRKAQ
jgi:hypothetical protein